MDTTVVIAIITFLGGVLTNWIAGYFSRNVKMIDVEATREQARTTRDEARDKRIDDMHTRIGELYEKVAAVGAKLTICLDDKEDMVGENTRLKMRFEYMEKRIEELTSKLASKDEEIRVLRENLEARDIRVSVLEAQVKQLQENGKPL